MREFSGQLTAVWLTFTLIDMEEQKKLLKKIIAIVEPESTSDERAQLFSILLFEETIYALLNTLSGKKLEKIKKQWQSNLTNYAAQVSILTHNFTEEQIKAAVETVTNKAVQDYMRANIDRLDDNQKRALMQLADEYPSKNITRLLQS